MEFCGGLAGAGGQALEHMAGQGFDVVTAFAQGRHPQFDHVQPVVQILAKTFGGDFGVEVFVGGAKDAHIDHGFLLPADTANGFFLNCPQQFDLHRQRQISHFVEEQGAAMGRLEQSGFVFDGTAEAAFAMAEKLALHQFRRNRPAIDRDKRLAGAGALLMDQSRDQLLAAAGFAADVHRRLAAGQFVDVFAQAAHGR